MGKSTISMATFNSFLYVYQRLSIYNISQASWGFNGIPEGLPWYTQHPAIRKQQWSTIKAGEP